MFLDPLLKFTNVAIKLDDNVESCSGELLNLLPKFSKVGITDVDNKICKEFSSFITQFALLPSSKDLDSESIKLCVHDTLEIIWKNIIKTIHDGYKNECKCSGNMLVPLFDLYAFALFKGESTMEPLTFNANLGRVYGLFAKWILEKNNLSKVESSIIERVKSSSIDPDVLSNIQTHVDQCHVTRFTQNISIKKEDGKSVETFNVGIGDSIIIRSFGTVFSSAVQFCREYNFIPPEMLLLSASFLKIEDSKVSFLENYQDLDVLKTGDDCDTTLYSQLITSDIGREVISREFGETRCYVSNLCLPDIDTEHKSGLCPCFYKMYESIALAAGHSLETGKLSFIVSTNDKIVKKTSVKFVLSRDFASHILNRVKIALDKKKTCISNISIHVKGLSENICKDVEFLKSTSPLVPALISLATVMDDSVYIDTEDSNKGLIRVLLRFRNSIDTKLPKNAWNILAKLLYMEISTDSKMALEYGNEQLSLYRTLLIRYLLQIAILQSNYSYKFKIGKRGLDISISFVRRLFRLLSFRINRNFMNKEQFVRFLKTRAITKRPKYSEDTEEDEDSDDIYDDWTVFGLLEYSPTHVLRKELLPKSFKTEDIGVEPYTHHNSSYTSDFYFFDVIYELFGIIRFSFEFEYNIIDNYMSHFFTLLCSKSDDFMDEFNRDVLNSSIIRAIFRTNEYGEKVDNENLVHSFGIVSKPNKTLEILGLLETKDRFTKRRIPDPEPIVGSLVLSNNRFKRQEFYRVSSRIIDAITRYANIAFISRALCIWNSSLPIDSVSSVKSHKIASARSTFTILILRIITVFLNNVGDVCDLISIEPLVSAINVIFINLELIHKRQEFKDYAEIISSDSSEYSNSGCMSVDLKSEVFEDKCVTSEPDKSDHVLGVSVENLDDFNVQVLDNWKRNKLVNKILIHNKRKLLREQRYLEANLLLHVSHTFVRIINNVVLELSHTLLDVDQGFLSKLGTKQSQEYHQTFVISCTGEDLEIYNNVLELLSLIYETIVTISRLCVIISFNSIHSKHDEHLEQTKNLHGYFDNKTVELIREIGILKKKAKLEIDRIFSIQLQETLSELPTQADCNSSDDLDDFIDFETDKHLSMLTYKDNVFKRPRNGGAETRLNNVRLRSEWECMIRTYLT
ncbi:conserved hypothetical protein [Theileria equi strain WA]|uniref:Uncharacterized protein n=1 Tax=Theileria equi strain WA TaxID=1537102 RepID=L1LFZ4_THEEQ|nr:conserved hypothetical protein [Theileria equi strain WA]EKX74194.1 conserved hypothetical protein [Theileria equi strain WA]|eukprot:XP_004833646.1 conserved hypothetical protein [Theileria equi strain WA]